MPLDPNLVYGTMVGSWIAHLAIPVAVLIAVQQIGPDNWKLWFILGCVGLSLVWQAMWLTVLQTSSCEGIKNVKGIAIGSIVAAAITACMTLIPVYIEPMRLIVSQLLISHKTLLTPAVAHVNDALIDSGNKIFSASIQQNNPEPTAPAQYGGAAITPDEYETQTAQEIAYGTSYWAAFAGAYGIGIGSLFAATCV
jgi:hypothetical protein